MVQVLRDGPFQDLTMKGLQQWSDPVAEGIPAAARCDPQSQPLKAATIARVFRPLVRRMMAGLDLVQGDLEHQIGPMGLGAHAEIGGEQESQIELIDRLVDGAGGDGRRAGSPDREPLGTEDSREARRSDLHTASPISLAAGRVAIKPVHIPDMTKTLRHFSFPAQDETMAPLGSHERDQLSGIE